MIRSTSYLRRSAAVASISLLLSFSTVLPSLAGPGAHGPNGEHLDAPAQTATAGNDPRMEARSELFELVAHLYDGELSILIDRFETNEPVLGATVEVEVGSIKAKARFHADHGDYAVDDPALLKALSRPGEHAVVYTVVAGDVSDLLEGSLVVNPHGDARNDHDHAGLPIAAWIGLGALVFGGGAFWISRRRKRRSVRMVRSGS